MSGFSTSKGTTLHYNLTGWDIAEATVTDKLENVETLTGFAHTAEIITGFNLEKGTDVKQVGKLTCSDVEVTILIPKDDAVTYDLWADAQRGEKAITIKAFLPVGTGITFLANAVVTKVDAPIEQGGFLKMALTFAISGLPVKL